MATPDIEDIADGLIAIFESDFLAELAAVDASQATPLNPKPPQQYIFGELNNIPVMPAILINGTATTEDEDEYDWRNQTYHFELDAYVTAARIEDANRIIRRYGTAIDNLLRKNQTVNGLAKNIHHINQDFSGVLKAPSGNLFQAVQVSFDVQVITN